jgi:hypothetical protein
MYFSLTEWLCRTVPALHRPVLIDGKICGNGFDAMYPRNPMHSLPKIDLIR